MAWQITCSNQDCDEDTWASDIVDLIDNHRGSGSWFLCECGRRGYIEKSYRLQEGGDPWEPFLKGAIPLGSAGDTYQPFTFLIGSDRDDRVDWVSIAYYKDLRSAGGRLKLGYGPGGPSVLRLEQVRGLIDELVGVGFIPESDVGVKRRSETR